MHLVQILLPRKDNEGTPFPPETFERLKRALADAFGGVTAFLQAPAEGLWQAGAARDEIVIFEVMVDRLDLADWRRRRGELEHRFRQERVIIRHMAIGLV